MRYIVDHDYHIHSQLSSCSRNPEQNNQRILEYAKENGFKKIVLTDHFWDDVIEGGSAWCMEQNYAHITKALPLPQAEGIDFLFGCETDLNKNLTLGISKEHLETLDFIIIPTTHLHMSGFTLCEDEFSIENRAKLWVSRLEAVLNMDLPFHKIGIAHLASKHFAQEGTREDYLKALELIPTDDMKRLFKKAATLGVGIELNRVDMSFSDEEADIVLRMFHIAKEEGCKFYFGSDAHHPDALKKAPEIFQRAIDCLNLTEDDKFHIKEKEEWKAIKENL